MIEVRSGDRPRAFLPSLEGVRGYGFLLVFFGHYFSRSTGISYSGWAYPLFLFHEASWIAVPAFFVLSGYLIGGILYNTRNREDYFRVFYTRRILRVFPVYYLTLIVLAIVDSLHGISLGSVYWGHFFYVQNWLPGYTSDPSVAPSNQTIHLWSLAVEEQFYLLWPLVVWAFPRRKALLKISLALIVLSCVVRCAAPWMHLTTIRMYFATPTRGDAILLGVVLALIQPLDIYRRLEPLAKYAALAGVGVLMVLAACTGSASPINTYLRSAVLLPFVNLIAAAALMAVMEEGSWFCRVCSLRWACWLGSLSYSLYVFHFIYCDWVLTTFVPRLAKHMPVFCAVTAVAAVAFCFTLLLGIISYRLVERPAMSLKKRLQYGPNRQRRVMDEAGLQTANVEISS